MAYVTVEIDMSDLDADDMTDELERRGIRVGDQVPDTNTELTEMFYAFKLGREDRAIELARKIAQDHTGGVL